MARLEKDFQHQLIKEIKRRLVDCVVLKLDPTYIQGIPDLLILYGNKWACLEVKRTKKASKRPNQEYWINKLNNMSFAKFIYPENKEGVLNELQQAFKSRRPTRLPKCK